MFFNKEKNAQGAMEYLLIIGAAILVVAIVIIALSGLLSQTKTGVDANTISTTNDPLHKILDGLKDSADTILYFKDVDDVDYAWDTIDNWWSDATFTIPANTLPLEGNTIYIAGEMITGPSTPITLSHIHVADDVTGGGTFGVNFTGANGKSTFNNGSYNNAGTVGDYATFNNDSANHGSGTGGVGNFATFNDNSINDNSLGSNATFNDSSFNQAAPVGDFAIFNDNSSSDSGDFVNATFNDTSTLTGEVNNCTLITFNDNSTIQGNISCNAIFNENSYVGGGAQVTGNVTFNDTSSNSNSIVGNAIFNDSSNNSGTVSGTCTFNDTSFNDPTLGICGSIIQN